MTLLNEYKCAIVGWSCSVEEQSITRIFFVFEFKVAIPRVWYFSKTNDRAPNITLLNEYVFGVIFTLIILRDHLMIRSNDRVTQIERIEDRLNNNNGIFPLPYYWLTFLFELKIAKQDSKSCQMAFLWCVRIITMVRKFWREMSFFLSAC